MILNNVEHHCWSCWMLLVFQSLRLAKLAANVRSGKEEGSSKITRLWWSEADGERIFTVKTPVGLSDCPLAT